MKVAGLIPLLLTVALAILAVGIHKIEEGHVGLTYFGGALEEGYTEPGWQFSTPFLTKVEQVQFTLQTDTVLDIPCGTSGGVMIYFDKIEVVNQLRKDKLWKTVKRFGSHYDKLWIFDKVHHEINQFCSSHTLQEVYIDKFSTLDEDLAKALQQDCNKWDTGIDIISIRVTKPRIPTSVKRNYEAVEKENSQIVVATQQQNVAVKQAETVKMSAIIQAEKEAAVALIGAKKEAAVALISAIKTANISKIFVGTKNKEKEGEFTLQQIQNEILLQSEKSKSDAYAYGILQDAEANEVLLTDEYLRIQLYESIANNATLYFGKSIPAVLYPTTLQPSSQKV
eukprot:TRINITY_DN15333_c0_g1_i1.p1 TRINITY_DN15333_c0_g1~~TRINITY_DN15333_c0_g1_i1.p1  ORF type:complete len:348 (+),score=87.28 TRINITY_DN15333_c0_g1_i1:28-1044(+)